MARITTRNAQKESFAQVFELYISAVTARGVKDETLATYKQHFHAISKRLDVSISLLSLYLSDITIPYRLQKSHLNLACMSALQGMYFLRAVMSLRRF